MSTKSLYPRLSNRKGKIMTWSETCLSDGPAFQCFRKEALGDYKTKTRLAVAILGVVGEKFGRGEGGEGVVKETVLSNVGVVYS